MNHPASFINWLRKNLSDNLIMYTRNPKLTFIIPRASRDSTLVMTKTLTVLGDVATPGISTVCCT